MGVIGKGELEGGFDERTGELISGERFGYDINERNGGGFICFGPSIVVKLGVKEGLLQFENYAVAPGQASCLKVRFGNCRSVPDNRQQGEQRTDGTGYCR